MRGGGSGGGIIEGNTMTMEEASAFLAEASAEFAQASAAMKKAVDADATAKEALDDATKVYNNAKDRVTEAVSNMHLSAARPG